ncbi:alcohol dehydrogenase -like domain-containing protein [Rutstroemia sp. NJR-2017a BBW]|nr:alcohol dehydrogenase -like domain-containing protein [Rutstroemia sp. NJR-2017a BBW]
MLIPYISAEYVRVPYAANALIPIPSTNTTNGTAIPDSEYLTLGDIFSTAWVGVTRSGFQPGDTIAIFGAGPVGLLAAYSAILRGASRVYSIDHEPTRLSLAQSIGAIPINFATTDPVSTILTHEPLGVRRAVDCVGFEALNTSLLHSPNIIFHQAVSMLATQGGFGGVGVYNSQANSSGTPLAALYGPELEFPAAEFFTKGLSWVTGAVDISEAVPELLRLVAGGVARPGFIVSAEVGIEEAPEYYARFDRHEETKVYINFP